MKLVGLNKHLHYKSINLENKGRVGVISKHNCATIVSHSLKSYQYIMKAELGTKTNDGRLGKGSGCSGERLCNSCCKRMLGVELGK